MSPLPQLSPDAPVAASSGPRRGRVLCIDTARTIAMLFVVHTHTLAALDGWGQLPGTARDLLRAVYWSATPLFVVLFGMTLEYVSVPRLETAGPRAVHRGLLQRCVQCYCGYVATALAAVLSGLQTPLQGLRAAAFLGDTRFSNILKFYTVAMLLAVPLVRFRERFGLGATVALLCVPWLLDPLLGLIAWPPPSAPISYLTGTLFGHPGRASGISTWHSGVLVGAGFLLGSAVRRAVRTGEWRTVYGTAGVLWAIGALVVLVLCGTMGPRAVVQGWIWRHFRAANHIAYYAIGLSLSSALVGLLARVFSAQPLDTQRWRAALVIGQFSIFAYPFGNVLLNLWPAWAHPPRAHALLASLVFLVAFLAVNPPLQRLWDHVWRRRAADTA
jgi:hypothetical protein